VQIEEPRARGRLQLQPSGGGPLVLPSEMPSRFPVIATCDDAGRL